MIAHVALVCLEKWPEYDSRCAIGRNGPNGPDVRGICDNLDCCCELAPGCVLAGGREVVEFPEHLEHGRGLFIVSYFWFFPYVFAP